jgi:hypothetical protein
MTDWQPVGELECLLDALETELLLIGDEELRQALGRRKPSWSGRVNPLADIAVPDAFAHTEHASVIRVFDRSLAGEPRSKDH